MKTKLIIFLQLSLINLIWTWQTIGVGVTYRTTNQNSPYNSVLITYAGYNVNQDQTQAWTDRLLSKSILNKTSLGINHVYAVKGPKEASYISKEIENSKLIAHIYSQIQLSPKKPKLIVIIAHSSGSFVADELFGQLYTKFINNPNDLSYNSLTKRIAYFNLDGATTPSRMDDAYIKKLFSSINFVWSSYSSLNSMNSATMISAPAKYSIGLDVKSVEIKATKSQCLNSKCLHDAVIIETPWDQLNYNTALDYTLFSVNGREVQSFYLESNENVLNNIILS